MNVSPVSLSVLRKSPTASMQECIKSMTAPRRNLLSNPRGARTTKKAQRLLLACTRIYLDNKVAFVVPPIRRKDGSKLCEYFLATVSFSSNVSVLILSSPPPPLDFVSAAFVIFIPLCLLFHCLNCK